MKSISNYLLWYPCWRRGGLWGTGPVEWLLPPPDVSIGGGPLPTTAVGTNAMEIAKDKGAESSRPPTTSSRLHWITLCTSPWICNYEDKCNIHVFLKQQKHLRQEVRQFAHKKNPSHENSKMGLLLAILSSFPFHVQAPHRVRSHSVLLQP